MGANTGVVVSPEDTPSCGATGLWVVGPSIIGANVGDVGRFARVGIG